MVSWKKLYKIFSFVQNAIRKMLDKVRGLWKLKPDKLNISMLILTALAAFLTAFSVFLIYYDIPNYPFQDTEEIPTKTYSYIDTRYGNYVTYEVDYTIKYRKWFREWFPPDYNISISLPIKVDGFKSVNEAMGRKIDIKKFDAPNDSVDIININKINPLLLHIAYVSEESIDPRLIIHETPLPDVQNNSIVLDSFFVKVQNGGGYDIKTLTLHSNVTKWIAENLIQLKNVSWINQPVMIYDGGLPVKETMIDNKGILTWEINSLNSGEQKVYYFKRMNNPSWQRRKTTLPN